MNNYSGEFYETTRYNNPSTWAQLKEKFGEPLQYYVDELNANIQKFMEENQ